MNKLDEVREMSVIIFHKLKSRSYESEIYCLYPQCNADLNVAVYTRNWKVFL